MALLDNRDPDRVPALIDGLPAPIRADLDALDLKRRDLSQLPFDLILLHGRDDPIIPATESQALAAAAPDDKVSLYVIDRLTHVEMGPGALLDSVGLWRAIYRLLSRRDAAPAPDAARCGRHPRRRRRRPNRRGNPMTAGPFIGAGDGRGGAERDAAEGQRRRRRSGLAAEADPEAAATRRQPPGSAMSPTPRPGSPGNARDGRSATAIRRGA